jgi:branched-chain amino acid transport system permease protein
MSGGRDLVQFIFSGLTGGSIYTLVALGFGVVHNTMGIVNFTQVDFVTLGGMVLYSALFAAHLPMPLALLVGITATALAAAAVEFIFVRHSRSRSHLVLIFLTVGLSVVLRGLMEIGWGKGRMAVPPLTGESPWPLFGAVIMPQTLWILAITALTMVGLSIFFKKTRFGLMMRGVASNPEAARAVGISVGRVRTASFAMAGALGGLAGVLVTPITTLSYDVGVLLGLKGFAAAILGGFGSFPGAVAGGLTLGLIESLGAAYFSSAYKDVTAFVLLLLVLFVRPQGLAGRKVR